MQTIGERLEEARKRKGISIREAAEATKIRGDYLQRFENNQFDIKLPDIYIRGFLRIYANLLKLPPEKLVNDYLALGLGEGGRPHAKVGREVYGRMEITHTGTPAKTSGPLNPASPGQPESNDAPTQTAATQRAPFQPRMPLGGLDRAMLAKNGPWIAAAAVAAAALLIWGVVALLSNPEDTTTTAAGSITESTRAALTTANQAIGNTTSVAPAADQVVLHALARVQVTSVKAKSDGRTLAPATTLNQGQSLSLPNVPMIVSVSAREAVQIGFKEGRYAASGTNVTGPGALDLDFTPLR